MRIQQPSLVWSGMKKLYRTRNQFYFRIKSTECCFFFETQIRIEFICKSCQSEKMANFSKKWKKYLILKMVSSKCVCVVIYLSSTPVLFIQHLMMVEFEIQLSVSKMHQIVCMASATKRPCAFVSVCMFTWQLDMSISIDSKCCSNYKKKIVASKTKLWI